MRNDFTTYKYALLSASAVLLALFQAASLAETVNTTADLQNHERTAGYLVSPPLLDVMYRLGLAQDKKFGLESGCIMQYRVQPAGTLVLAPIDFPDGLANPTRGAWFARYRLERCGDAKLYNVLFVASGNGALPTARTYYPGATIASPELVNDAMPSVMSGAQARAGLKDCKDVDVFDMRVTEPVHDVVEGDRTIPGVWKETWTLRMCGQMHDVAVIFRPDASGSGTAFHSGAATPRDAGGE
jgi:hypothetical protein